MLLDQSTRSVHYISLSGEVQNKTCYMLLNVVFNNESISTILQLLLLIGIMYYSIS